MFGPHLYIEVIEEFARFRPGTEFSRDTHELPMLWTEREKRKPDVVEEFIRATPERREAMRAEILARPRRVWKEEPKPSGVRVRSAAYKENLKLYLKTYRKRPGVRERAVARVRLYRMNMKGKS